jgi:putative transcriptional regulator
MMCLLKNRLAECRAARQMSKSKLAFRLKMSRSHVTRLERGDVRPSLETAFRIAGIFHKPVEEIFQFIEEGGNQQAGQATGLEASPGEAPSTGNSPSVSATDGNLSTLPIESERKQYAD